jgi:hypothetical protein
VPARAAIARRIGSASLGRAATINGEPSRLVLAALAFVGLLGADGGGIADPHTEPSVRREASLLTAAAL